MRHILQSSIPWFEFRGPVLCFGDRLFEKGFERGELVIEQGDPSDVKLMRKFILVIPLPEKLQQKTGQEFVLVEDRGLRKVKPIIALSIDDQEVWEFVESLGTPSTLDQIMERKQITSEIKAEYGACGGR